MPKRRIDPITGEPELTYREQMLVDEFIKNGGNGSRAAVSAGYGSARPDQSAHQVLRRPEVQRRIQQRIAESRVSADEIIGTLASFMRGTLADFYDESGEFSIEAAKERGVDHQLKTITTTTRKIEATKDKPAEVVRTCRGTLHSPVQAATVLARILGIYGGGACRSLTADHRPLTTDLDHQPLTTDHRPLTTDLDHQPLTTDFHPLVWLDDLISDQMRQTGQSRSAVIHSLIQRRPEIAKYVRELEDSRGPKPFDDLSLRDTARQVDNILDLLISRANGASAESDAAGTSADPDAVGAAVDANLVGAAVLGPPELPTPKTRLETGAKKHDPATTPTPLSTPEPEPKPEPEPEAEPEPEPEAEPETTPGDMDPGEFAWRVYQAITALTSRAPEPGPTPQAPDVSLDTDCTAQATDVGLDPDSTARDSQLQTRDAQPLPMFCSAPPAREAARVSPELSRHFP